MTVSRRDFLRGLGAAALFAHPLERALTGTAWADVVAGAPRGVHLSFAGDPTSTATAMWFTNSGTDPGSLVRWAPVPPGADPATLTLDRVASGVSRATPGVDALAHEVTLTGLAPGGLVAYRAGSEGAWSPVRAFRTLAGGRAPLRMVAFGDHGVGETSRRTTLACLEADPDLVLVAGDISYANGKQSVWDTYFDEVEPLSAAVPTMTAMGNHDNEDPADGGFGYDTYRARFAQPGDELHYSFDAGNVHVLVLEAGEAVDDPAQLADEIRFAEQDLAVAAARRTRGEIDFVVVMQHFPIWSNHETRGNDESLIAAQEPLFQRYGIDLLVVGHNHHYERSKPMVNGEPTIAELRHYPAQREGYVEVITGGGGKGLYEFVPPADVQPWSAVYAKRFHYTRIDVAGQEMRVTAIATDSADGEVLDEFSLTSRNAAGPVPAIGEGAPGLLVAAGAAAAAGAVYAAGRSVSHAG